MPCATAAATLSAVARITCDVADGADRRAVAGAHAGRAHDAHVGAEPVRQVAQEMLGARHGAGERVAHAHGDGGRRRLAFLHHVEMGVEGRDLVHLGERELHLLRQRREMRGGEIAVRVLDQMQMLDQEIAPARAVAEQRAHLVERLRVDLAALGRTSRAVAPSRPGSLIVGPRVHAGILLKAEERDVVDQKQAPNYHQSIEIYLSIVRYWGLLVAEATALIDKLEFLLALARERHFGRAAEACGVTQPTLSAGIKQLEDTMGVLLVNRGSRFQSFTPEGERVLDWARRIVGDSRAMRQELEALRHGLTGRLRIAAIPTTLAMVASLTTPFRMRHPNVQFTILSRTSIEVLAQLENLEIDAGADLPRQRAARPRQRRCRSIASTIGC